MPRVKRITVGGWVYHVLNRANGRMTLFHSPADYAAFERVLAEAVERFETRLLAYCLMPNHWHLLLWPCKDGQLSGFMRWLTLTHTQRRHTHRHRVGEGHLYQGRFKSFPVREDRHFLIAARYVERNAQRAGLVGRAEDWRWCSLRRRLDAARYTMSAESETPPDSTAGDDAKEYPALSAWPVPRPSDWLERVNLPLSEAEERAMKNSLRRNCPLGDAPWQLTAAQRMGLLATLRPRGRPAKERGTTVEVPDPF